MTLTHKLTVILLVLLTSASVSLAQEPQPFPTPPEDAIVITGEILQELELPEDFELEGFLSGFSQSNPEAATAIAGFASVHMGANIMPEFAQKVRSGLLVDSDISAQLIDEIAAEMSEEAQTLLSLAREADIDGATYYGLMENGLAVVFTASDCTGRRCTVDVEQLQVNIEEASMGLFAFYADVDVPSADAALGLILNTYPELRDAGLEAYYADETYADGYYTFTARDTS
ncbi:MAG: hypothetical protein AAFR22_20645, partial [Chloroflexota bacterium]